MVKEAGTISVSVSELAAAVEAHPDHPVAKVYKKAISGFPPEHRLAIERVDLEALLENLPIKKTQTTEHGILIERKSVDRPIPTP